MKKKREPMLRVSAMHRYVNNVLGRPVANGESLLELVAESLCQRHSLERRPQNARKFVERYRHLVLGQALQPRIAPVAPKPVTVGTTNVVSDAFLSTYEWRRVRMQALKRHGARCQCCGATPATGAVMNVDHIKPRKLFPHLALDVENLQVLCHECNHGKGNWDMTDWRETCDVP